MKNIYWHIAAIVSILLIMYPVAALLSGIVNPAFAYGLGAGIGYIISVNLTNAIKNWKKK